MAGSTDRISCRVSFYPRLVGKLLSPPKMTLMKFLGSWKPCAPDLSPWSSSFAVLIDGRCVEGLAEGDAPEERVLGLRAHRALLVQDLFVLVLLVPRLLAARVALNNHNFIV
jgi:hypothetical protein